MIFMKIKPKVGIPWTGLRTIFLSDYHWMWNFGIRPKRYTGNDGEYMIEERGKWITLVIEEKRSKEKWKLTSMV